jgi:hypoxia up-regulated 1
MAEAATRRKEEARNALEAYLYRVRDLLEEEGDTPFRKCSREEERQTLNQKLEETVAWLHDDGDDASTSDYIQRRTALE